jgi:hypothetical protein
MAGVGNFRRREFLRKRRQVRRYSDAEFLESPLPNHPSVTELFTRVLVCSSSQTSSSPRSSHPSDAPRPDLDLGRQRAVDGASVRNVEESRARCS